MNRILFITGILILAFTAAAFANDADATTNVSVTTTSYVNITGSGSASGVVSTAAYDTGTLDLTETTTDLTASSNAAFTIKAKLDNYIGLSNAVHPNLKLTVAGTDATGQITLTQADQTVVNRSTTATNSIYTQDYTITDITPSNVPMAGGNYACIVTFTIAQ